MKAKPGIVSGYIHSLEIKMLPCSGLRDRNESPKCALTREECLLYADYLETKGHLQSAIFFRREGDWGLNKQKPKKGRRKK